MELQRKRSFNTSTISHDFRKEYKGSFLEKKFMKLKKDSKKTGLKTLAEWILTKASAAKKSGSQRASGASVTTSSVAEKLESGANIVTVHEKPSYFDNIPNEVLFQILQHGKSSEPSFDLAARRVSHRFNACMDYVSDVKVNVLSRLVISGLGKKGIEMRWVSYEGQKTKTIVVPWNIVRSSKSSFEFNFKRFAIQRILLKNVPLSDELVDFLRRQLQFSDLSKLIQLSLSQVDFSPTNCLTLHRFLAPLAKTLEIFEITHCSGMRADSVTDDHMVQLDASTVRRICIDGVKFSSGSTRNLDIGDGSLRRFAKLGAFPTIILDRCAVTTNTVCDYTKEWFEQCNDTEKQLRSQVCTVKRCPKVKGSQFESECRRRGLRCKNRRGSGSLTLYNVQEENTKREFTIALAALGEKELVEKLKTSECRNDCNEVISSS